MSITFQDWQNWTNDEGIPTYTLDWSSPEAMKHYPPRAIYEALRQAVLERRTVLAQLGPTEEVKQNERIEVWQDPRTGQYENSVVEKLRSIDHNVKGLVSHFINHENNGGNWDNTDTPPPNWTQEEMLAVIGYDGWLEPQYNNPKFAEWAYQMHLVLNKLRWINSNELYGYDDKDHSTTEVGESNNYFLEKYDRYGGVIAPHLSDHMNNDPWSLPKTVYIGENQNPYTIGNFYDWFGIGTPGEKFAWSGPDGPISHAFASPVSVSKSKSIIPPVINKKIVSRHKHVRREHFSFWYYDPDSFNEAFFTDDPEYVNIYTKFHKNLVHTALRGFAERQLARRLNYGFDLYGLDIRHYDDKSEHHAWFSYSPVATYHQRFFSKNNAWPLETDMPVEANSYDWFVFRHHYEEGEEIRPVKFEYDYVFPALLEWPENGTQYLGDVLNKKGKYRLIKSGDHNTGKYDLEYNPGKFYQPNPDPDEYFLSAKGARTEDLQYVLKFDVPGGFTFIEN